MKTNKNNLKDNRALIGIALLLVIVMFMLVWFSLSNIQISQDRPSITPRPEAEIIEEYEAYENQPEEGELSDPLGGELSLLHGSVPHHDDYFSIIYNEEDFWYYYYIDPENQEVGKNDLEEFLQKHGIPSITVIDGRGFYESKEPLQ